MAKIFLSCSRSDRHCQRFTGYVEKERDRQETDRQREERDRRRKREKKKAEGEEETGGLNSRHENDNRKRHD